MKRHLNLVAGLAAAGALALPVAAFSEDAPGEFKVPGTDTTLKIYGFVQIDATYDLEGKGPGDFATYIPTQPLKGDPAAEDKGELQLSGRISRFGFQTKTPTSYGPLTVRLEGDFYNGNTGPFRLRHAYGSVGGLLVGRTWSNFIDLNTSPDTVDFGGPGVAASNRSEQIRYTFQPSSQFSVAVAAEKGMNDSEIPDLTAQVGFTPSWGTVTLVGVTNSFRYGPGDDESTKRGYGVGAGVSLKLGKDTLIAFAEGGKGIGGYVTNADIQGGLSTDENGDPALWTIYGYHAGYTHVWSDSLRSNLIWAQTFFKDDGLFIDDGTGTGTAVPDTLVNKRLDQAFVNTFWAFAKNAQVGVEYVYGLRKTFGNVEGKESRINANFHYNFF